MTKLTRPQQDLLGAAAARDDGMIEASPRTKVAAALIKRGLAIAVPVDEGKSRVMITTQGRAAIGPPTGDTAPTPPARPTSEPGAPPPATTAATPKGKLGELLALLRREEGASLEAMMTATGWQAHSVRGAISGTIKKRLRLTVMSEKVGGERRYRISAGVDA